MMSPKEWGVDLFVTQVHTSVTGGGRKSKNLCDVINIQPLIKIHKYLFCSRILFTRNVRVTARATPCFNQMRHQWTKMELQLLTGQDQPEEPQANPQNLVAKPQSDHVKRRKRTRPLLRIRTKAIQKYHLTCHANHLQNPK